MDRFVAFWLGTLILATTVGCRSTQLANDQDHIRQAVLELHTTQIIDNLVRLDKGLPIVQLDYLHMTGTITQNEQGTFGGGQTTVSTSSEHFPAVITTSIAAFSRAFTNTFSYSTQAGQTNQLTITAEPVTNNSELYNAYLEFLKDKSNLMCTKERPAPCDAIVCRSYPDPCCATRSWWWSDRSGSDVYYWVPTASRDAFRRLSLYAVALRVDGTTVATTAFPVKIVGVDKVEHPDPSVPAICTIWIITDKNIPNDNGTLIATIKGRLYSDTTAQQIPVLYDPNVTIAQAQDTVPAKQKTHHFGLSVNLVTMGLVAANATDDQIKSAVDQLINTLGGMQVSIKLRDFAPTQGRTENLLEDIRSTLELQRLNQAL
jgi:hypothetical protein